MISEVVFRSKSIFWNDHFKMYKT